ncbi:hypothetical protein LT330_003506 [Penicillium expansum]|nr:hypothetical protein LT330_003506 [Penicillium expansum]
MAGSKCSFPSGDEVEHFLSDLPPSMNRYTYEGKEQFDQILKIEYDRFERSLHHLDPNAPEISEYFVIAIDPSSFEKEFLLPDPIAGLRLFYHAALHILILRMTTPEHAQAAMALNSEVLEILQPMGLFRALQGFGGVNIDVGNGSIKQPDWGWGPIRRSRGDPQRPKVVVEVAVSETATNLRNNARLWVDPVRGRANLAITVKVNRKKPQITIDTYEWDSGTQHPRVTQSCVIEETCNNITVSQYPIVIPFHHIFGRAPEIPKETDVQLGRQHLVNFATSVWPVQEISS